MTLFHCLVLRQGVKKNDFSVRINSSKNSSKLQRSIYNKSIYGKFMFCGAFWISTNTNSKLILYQNFNAIQQGTKYNYYVIWEL